MMLRRLDLSGVALGDEGWEALKGPLGDHSSLNDLILRDTKLSKSP